MPTRPLSSARRGAAPGTARSAVIFVHGYGADGADLLGLAGPLAPHLPATAFYSPDAPEPCAGNPMGRQWFPIPWLDGSSEAVARAGLLQAADDLNAFVDGVLAAENLSPAALALVGFSQGTMISLHIAPRRAQPLGAVVGFSGRLLAPEALGADLRSRPPVLLVHGDADPMVPVSDLPRAAQALTAAGITTQTHIIRGLGHGIDGEGLGQALAFLHRHLPA